MYEKTSTLGEIKKMNQIWSEAERQFIRENAGILTDKAGSEQLTRITGRKVTIHAWRKQRQKMGISKKDLPPSGSTVTEINHLHRQAQNH